MVGISCVDDILFFVIFLEWFNFRFLVFVKLLKGGKLYFVFGLDGIGRGIFDVLFGW